MHSIGAPIHIYPLYENAFRAHRRQTLRENNDESAALYADFAQVAARNEYSWNHENAPASKREIGTVSRRNRMICLPCEPHGLRRGSPGVTSWLICVCDRSAADECLQHREPGCCLRADVG